MPRPRFPLSALPGSPVAGCCLAAGCLILMTGCSEPDRPSASGPTPAAPPESPAVENPTLVPPVPRPAISAAETEAILDEAAVDSVSTAPGLEERAYVGPLADAYERIDPMKDGWSTEAFHQAAKAQLDTLAKQLGDPESAVEINLDTAFATSPWLPSQPVPVRTNAQGLSVTRLDARHAPLKPSLEGPEGLTMAASGLTALFSGVPKVKFKHYRIEPESRTTVRSRARLEAVGTAADGHGKAQVTAEWDLAWIATLTPGLKGIELAEWEMTTYQGTTKTLFEDRTTAVLGKNPSYHEQLLRGTDHWRSRLPRIYGLDVVANHGLAMGDVNGDRLDDLYLCMQGGLPNRLYLRNPDGTLTDATADSGADWLDYCASALFVDFDNDGDRDLVVGQEWRILFMENDGQAHFDLAFGLGTHAQTFAIAAADYDVDGDVDLYLCGYNTSVDDVRSGAMGEPMPYHDAQNGGANMLLRNDGNWEFNEVTNDVGLNHNNNRFSFAAAWEDYDNDGDLDLYVANDYGRNNLYQNNNGQFRDIAGPLGLEDMSSGMSVAWGDHNRDGWMDLYVSNMFSAAGNRITYQRQFKNKLEAGTKAIFQRHARGNSLFEGTGDGQFRDVSVEADVTMGRWAWGSAFVDINNDSWQDLIVANGFITTDDTGDL